MDGDQIAILTDLRFVFYPDKNDTLIFMQRPFKRIGKIRQDLPYFTFKESTKNIAGI